jgi:hypothetical protein
MSATSTHSEGGYHIAAGVGELERATFVVGDLGIVQRATASASIYNGLGEAFA